MLTTKEKLTTELIRSTKDFIQYAKEYAPFEMDSSFSEQQWNIGQIIEHVILTDQNIRGLLSLKFKKRKNGHYSKYQMRNILLNRTIKVKNPEMVTPKVTENKPIDIWLKEFEEQRNQLINQVIDEKYDLESEEAFPHFKFGLLTKRDWIYLVCFHSDRHIAQMQEKLFCH